MAVAEYTAPNSCAFLFVRIYCQTPMSAIELPQHSKPSTNGLFTCLACHVAFPTSERQRDHYRTE